MSRNVLPRSVERLINEFARLPGIGPKTASRLTFYLLRAADDQVLELAGALDALKSTTQLCSTCFNITEDDPCPICSDEGRDAQCAHQAAVDVIEPLGGGVHVEVEAKGHRSDSRRER